MNALEEKAAAVPEDLFPFDYHLYQIDFLDYGILELEIEKEHQLMSVSYMSDPKKKKYMDKVAQDIYLYYGVTAEDITEKTERFNMLVAELSAF